MYGNVTVHDQISFHFQCVPIPTITRRCDNKCCSQTYVPLTTAHPFLIEEICTMKLSQNEKILCNPGRNINEKLQPGLLYACVRKAHTLGGVNPSDSSLFFTDFYEGLDQRFQYDGLKKQLHDNWKQCMEIATYSASETYTAQQIEEHMANWTNQQLTKQNQNFIDHYTHNADI